MKKSGVVARFGLKLLANSNSSDNDDALSFGAPQSPLHNSNNPSPSRQEDGITVDTHSNNVVYAHVDYVRLAPTAPSVITQRENVWWKEPQRNVSSELRRFMEKFLETHEIIHDPDYRDFNCEEYQRTAKIPRFAARYQRIATALLASWSYCFAPSRAPDGELHTEGFIPIANKIIAAYLAEVESLFPKKSDGSAPKFRLYYLASRIAYDGIVRRCYVNSLRLKRQKLCKACLLFITDASAIIGFGNMTNKLIIHELLPSINNTADRVLKHILPLEPLTTAIPSDIPMSAFDGSRTDLFGNEERIRLYLIAPKRIPYLMMAAPPSSHFAYATLPSTYDDYHMPGMLAGNGQDRSTGESNQGASDFITNARVKTAQYLRSPKNLVKTPQGRSLLPLCAVSVIDRAMRSNGLHNEDRWWMTNFVSDMADFDMEDLGDLFDVFAGRSEKHTHRFNHMVAHRGRYNDAVAESVAGGFPPLMTKSCKTMMSNRSYERSERRGAYCPFVANNNATPNEIRQLLKWQGVDFDEDSIQKIVDFAVEGNQAEGCLAHYNAILKARGDLATRENAIKMPPLFSHFQAMRRDNEADANT